MRRTTRWRVEPSFKYDVLCFLNILTNDPFYLTYYQTVYDEFVPKFMPSSRDALIRLKQKVKDEGKKIISAWLTLVFSVTSDETLEDLLRTLENPTPMWQQFQQTPYYDEESTTLFQNIVEELQIIFGFLQDIRFEAYWERNVRPRLEQKIDQIRAELPHYDIVPIIEQHLGFSLPSDEITVYVLNYCQPHGIKLTGACYLTDVTYPFRIVLQNAIHEMMHPPYAHDDQVLKRTLAQLQHDDFVMDKVQHHNPAFGYNSFEGYIEENIVQALDQLISEHIGIGTDAATRWTKADEGMHVFAAALYATMKRFEFEQSGETIRDFLVKMIEIGELGAGRIQTVYETFYAQ